MLIDKCILKLVLLVCLFGEFLKIDCLADAHSPICSKLIADENANYRSKIGLMLLIGL